jgi:hypothetical protein
LYRGPEIYREIPSDNDDESHRTVVAIKISSGAGAGMAINTRKRKGSAAEN